MMNCKSASLASCDDPVPAQYKVLLSIALADAGGVLRVRRECRTRSRCLAGTYRYRVLLEITDLIAHAKSLPEAFKELAPRVLALTGCELLTFSHHDPRRNCMLTQYWKRPGKWKVQRFSGRRSGERWHGNIRRRSPFRTRSANSAFTAVCRCCRSWRSIVHVLPMSTPLFILGRRLGQEGCRGAPCRRCRSPFTHCAAGAVTLEKQRGGRALEEQQAWPPSAAN